MINKRNKIQETRYKIIEICLLIFVCSLFLGTWSFRAEAWRITPELQQELDAKQAAVNKDPNSAAARFDLAVTQSYTNHLIDGMNSIKQIPKLDAAYKKQALDIYLKKVIASPSDWRLRFRLAFAYYFNDMKMDAIREFKNVLIIDPYNVWAYGYLALLYGEIGEVDKAMAITKEGLAIDNNVAALHLLLGEGYYKKGDSWKGFLERMEALRLKALGY